MPFGIQTFWFCGDMLWVGMPECDQSKDLVASLRKSQFAREPLHALLRRSRRASPRLPASRSGPKPVVTRIHQLLHHRPSPTLKLLSIQDQNICSLMDTLFLQSKMHGSDEAH